MSLERFAGLEDPITPQLHNSFCGFHMPTECEPKDKRLAAQAALLDRVPHDRFSDGTQCRPDCPACAWAKLREAK